MNRITRDTPIDWAKGKWVALNGKTLAQLNGEQIAYLDDHAKELPAGWSLAVHEEIDRREQGQ